MSKITYYHAGCSVCVEAEQKVVDLLLENHQVDIVNIGEDAKALSEAKAIGVKSVPALSIDGTVFHINFGASVDVLGA